MQDEPWLPNKEDMLGERDMPKTQALFLEINYNHDAIYTTKGDDHTLNGKTYKSIKKLYLELEDVTEFEFANRYFLDYEHWIRITNNQNKVLQKTIDQMRYELELKLRARAMKQMMAEAEGGNMQAIRWLAEKQWGGKKAGRPSKAESMKEDELEKRIMNEFEQDRLRLVRSVG